jgi:hypothetical protein
MGIVKLAFVTSAMIRVVIPAAEPLMITFLLEEPPFRALIVAQPTATDFVVV